MYPDYPFRANYFNIGNIRLHYLDVGSGPAVVLVHGNPTWSYYFRNLIGVLQEKHRVIAIDHVGCGLSDKPQDYKYCLSQHIDNLQSLIEHLDLQKYSLVMHDWGGAIGMGCAVRHMDLLERLVVMNTAAFRSTLIPARINICRLPIVGDIIVRLFNGFAWPATFMAVTKFLSRDVAKAYVAPYDCWQNRIAIHRFVQDIPLFPQHPSYQTLLNIENNLSVIRAKEIPIQVVWGGADFCFSRTFYERWLQLFPEAESHYWPDGGHYLLEDKKDEVIPMISRFLDAAKPIFH